MAATSSVEPPTMRERYRAQVRDEVKQAALRQLAALGPRGLSVAAIAMPARRLRPDAVPLLRQPGRTADRARHRRLPQPGGRAARNAASPQACSRTPGSKHSPAPTYRYWALARPHPYRLLYGLPLPGYYLHAQRLVDDASRAAMNPRCTANAGSGGSFG